MTQDRPPSYLLQKPADLRHLTRREALQQLADACLHRDWVLPLCIDRLPASVFDDYEVRMVFGTIAGRWQRGAWDPESNLEYVAAVLAVTECQALDWFVMPRDRLVLQVNVEGWFWELDNWYCPWTMSQKYVAALLDGLEEADQVIADTAQLSVRERLYAGPFAVDQDLEDSVYRHSAQLVAMRRGHRLAKVVPPLPELTLPQPAADWERILERNL
jgi:hypothetical protein